MTAVTAAAAAALQRRLEDEQRRGRLPSLVAGLVRQGELVWQGAAGAVDGGAPEPRTQYRIGSITKTFVGLSVLRLVDAGRVDLDDRVADHVSDAPVGRATLRQLLSHTAGLRAETAGPWWERAPGGDWDALVGGGLQPPATPLPAGERYHYSNVGFAVLGRLLALAHGMPWDAVVRTDWLAPLGMADTTPRPRAPFAPGLAVHPWADAVLPEPEHDAGAMAPAGQLWSTIGDLARWAAFLAGDGDGLLSSELLDRARRTVSIDDRPGQPWTAGYGLGLQVYDRQGRRSFGHGGSMPGFLALLVVDGDTRDGVVLAANATAGLSATLPVDLLELLWEHAPTPQRAWTPDGVDAAALALAGVWYWGPTPVSITARADGLLELKAVAGNARASRFRRRDDGAWLGLDGYYAGEILHPVTATDGEVRWLDLASFIFTRTPYDAQADVPGGVAPGGWR